MPSRCFPSVLRQCPSRPVPSHVRVTVYSFMSASSPILPMSARPTLEKLRRRARLLPSDASDHLTIIFYEPLLAARLSRHLVRHIHWTFLIIIVIFSSHPSLPDACQHGKHGNPKIQPSASAG